MTLRGALASVRPRLQHQSILMDLNKAIAGPAQDVEFKEISPPPPWRYFASGEVLDNRIWSGSSLPAVIGGH
jgi:hypothetical protein